MTLPPFPAQPSDTPWPAQDWPRGDLPASADSAKLTALLDTAFAPAAAGPMGETHAFLAIHRGRIVAERYAGGEHTATSTYPSWSMAKSITQLLIGFLAAEGRIELELAGGHRLRVVGSYDPEALARLIRGLGS